MIQKLAPFILILSLSLICFRCNLKKSEPIELTKLNSIYNQYIASHTTGQISKHDPIRIQFSQIVTNQSELKNAISLNPQVPGQWNLIDESTIEFKPAEPFRWNAIYDVSIELEKLFTEVPKDLALASFNFGIIKPNFEVERGNLKFKIDHATTYQIALTIRTSDDIEEALAEKMFSLGGVYKSLPIAWNHINSRIHQVTITGIQRQEDTYEIPYVVSGIPIDAKEKISSNITIPAIGEFRIQQIKTDPEAANYIDIIFSDPLQKNQNLKGLISIEGVKDYTYQIVNNRAQVFFNKKLKGEKTIRVHPGIKNDKGQELNNEIEKQVTFELVRPQVRFASKGTILPSSNNNSIPFESINLKAIDVKVYQIFADNIPIYLQENAINSSQSYLHRVGAPIMIKTIPLDIDLLENQNEWLQHHLDLNEVFTIQEGALFKIELSFRKPMAIYPCTGQDSTIILEDLNSIPWNTDPISTNSWNSYYPQGYEWQRREDPCHVSFYTADKNAVTNIIRSDLGLLAKVSNDKTVHVYSTNLLSALPESNVSLSLLDYQLQPIMSTSTNDMGMATLSPDKRPFLILATKGDQQSYLRLDDGQSLSLSHFDISGQQVKEGLKVFVYGERGVWRPGDQIYISCMIDDETNPLPLNHPIQLKLKNPQGAVIDEQIQPLNKFGLITFKTQTAADALTGAWIAEIIVGDQSFSKKMKVETIQPNRLKAEISMDGSTLSSDKKTWSDEVKVQWLTGIPGRNLKLEYHMDLWDRNSGFDGYDQYNFRDASRKLSFDDRLAFKTTTNENGIGNFQFNIPQVKNAPGKIQLVLKGKIFEPGGNFSIDNRVIEYSPFSHYIGMNLPRPKDNTYYKSESTINIQTISLNENGNATERSKLSYTLSKMNWRWWWDQSGGRANYVGSDIGEEVSSGNFVTTKGNASIQIKPPSGGRYFLQICDDESGHCVGEDIYVSWRDGENQELGSNILSINAEQNSYDVGQDIVMNIPGYDNARALVSIENGSGILHSEWITLSGNQTQYKIQASNDMVPNIYCHISLIQPHDQTINDLPIRLYGITPINIKDPNSVLQPTIDIPKKIEPEKEFIIKVAEANQHPMSYTLAIVDEGLLDITKFNTPNPWQHFNSKEALGVKTWDLYDHIIGSYGTRIERLLSIGGDGSETTVDNKQPSRFDPVIKFLGPFYLTANEAHEHKITLPNYIGSIKTMVVASNDQSYGHAETNTPVIKPIMVLGTLPRTIGPGETTKLPVSVFSLSEDISSIEVSVEAQGVITIGGQASQEVKFSKLGDEIINFQINAGDQVGDGKVIIKAVSGSYRAYQEIDIISRIANPRVTEITTQLLESNSNSSLMIPKVGLNGTNRAVLELSTLPPLNLESRLNFLIGYPHGCLEQTTSKAFPQMYLAEVADLSDRQSKDINQYVSTAIQKIKKFQNASGGFSYWPERSIDYWATNYAGHFLLEAQLKGYAIPELMLNSFIRFQKKTARGWNRFATYNDDIHQTYRLYTLAIAGHPELGMMNRLREDPKISWLAQWQLAQTYAIIGQSKMAASIIENIKVNQTGNENYINSYGSSERNKSIVLETYNSMNKRAEAFELIKELADALSSDKWMSTQTTAFILKAIGKTVANNSSVNGIDAMAIVGNNNEEIILKSGKPISIYPLDIESLDLLKVEVKNLSDNILFARVVSSGVPKAGQETANQKNLSCKLRYLNEFGESINDLSQISQGTNLKIQATITNISGSTIQDIALSQIFPSGWEIVNNRLIDGFVEEQKYDYQDIRDDRIYTYFDLKAGQKMTISSSINNTYAGTYYLPATVAEAMYDDSNFSITQGQWITITP